MHSLDKFKSSIVCRQSGKSASADEDYDALREEFPELDWSDEEGEEGGGGGRSVTSGDRGPNSYR
jgi:hypothetical protein